MTLGDAFGFLGEGCPVIAEIAQAHDGSLGTAHAMIDAAAEAGAAAVKFQTHIAAAESTRDEPWRVPFSRQDSSRYDYWRRMEFTEEQWAGLASHCAEKGVAFLSSPFSAEAVAMLTRIGVPAFKVASGEVADSEVMEPVLSSGLPVIVSTGLSPFAEIDEVVAHVREAGVPLALMQCTTAYPAPPADWGLRVIAEMKERYRCPVGFSDHSGTVAAGVAACALGADLIEVHVTFSRDAFGPDVPASLTFEGLADLVAGTRSVVEALSTEASKDHLAARAAPLRGVFGRSWALVRDLPAGSVVARDDLALKKPGTGISPERVGDVIGRTLTRDVPADRLLVPEDLG